MTNATETGVLELKLSVVFLKSTSPLKYSVAVNGRRTPSWDCGEKQEVKQEEKS